VIFLIENSFSIEFFSKKGKLVKNIPFSKYFFGKMSKSGSDFYFIFCVGWGGGNVYPLWRKML
jgi:hypothetical protein